MADYPMYDPERPEQPCGNFTNPPCPPPPQGPMCGGPHFPHKPGPGPGPCQPPYPPGHNPCIPQIHPVPPVPSPIEGSSLYEQMGMLTQRVNVCINQWNTIQANCYEALNQVVEAARSNDVYYDDCEVHYQEGYDETEGAAYAIIEKKAVDRKNQPIFVRLYPAYGNTSNPGVRQKIFDASFIKSANVIITAVQSNANTWSGPALINGAGMPGTEQEDGYVYGFTRGGALRYFPSNVTETTLCQQGMVDVIGGCVPILYDGKILDEVVTMTDREAVTAIGFNSGTGSVFFFACSAQNEPGMGIASVARVLQGYGCTTAVVTSHQVNDPTASTSEGMLYMGNMTMDPVRAIQPDNLAYWVVTKQPCFRNRFQKEIADLVQTTGRNAWETYLLGVQIQSFDDRITANSQAIKDEQERAMQAESWLQENINKEVNRAMQAEAWLQENINKEVERATAAENALDTKIEAETDRATAAELQIRSDLNDEILRATNREREISDQLEREITARINADKDIIQSIEQEILARKAADTELRTYIEKLVSEANANIGQLEITVNGIISGATSLPYLKLTGGILSGAVGFTDGNTLTLGRGPTLDMEAATKKYVDDAVAAGGGGGGGGDVTKEYVDQQIATVQGQLDGKVNKNGDTMSGALNMDGNAIENPVLSSNQAITVNNGAGGAQRITGVATPSDSTDATPKNYVDNQIANAIASAEAGIAGKYLPLTGGDMTGTINMTGTSEVDFYDQKDSTGVALLSLENQELKGKVRNQETNMVLESTSGQVQLVGTDIAVKNQEGEAVQITGVQGVHVGDVTTPGYTVTENNGLNVMGSFTNFLANGGQYAPIGSAGHSLYNADGTLSALIGAHNGHLDINVTNSAGSVYINRNGTEGGTGEMWLTEVHSPNELRFNPGTNINVMQTFIRNLKAGVQDLDAVNVSQLNDVITTVTNLAAKIAGMEEFINKWSSMYMPTTTYSDVSIARDGNKANINLTGINSWGYVQTISGILNPVAWSESELTAYNVLIEEARLENGYLIMSFRKIAQQSTGFATAYYQPPNGVYGNNLALVSEGNGWTNSYVPGGNGALLEWDGDYKVAFPTSVSTSAQSGWHYAMNIPYTVERFTGKFPLPIMFGNS